jgi:hypothetical protein
MQLMLNRLDITIPANLPAINGAAKLVPPSSKDWRLSGDIRGRRQRSVHNRSLPQKERIRITPTQFKSNVARKLSFGSIGTLELSMVRFSGSVRVLSAVLR